MTGFPVRCAQSGTTSAVQNNTESLMMTKSSPALTASLKTYKLQHLKLVGFRLKARPT